MNKLKIIILVLLIYFTNLTAVLHIEWLESFSNEITDVKFQNNYIYISTVEEGLFVYSFIQGEIPTLISNFTDISTSNLILDGNNMYIRYLRVISKYDISNPSNITFIDSFEIPNNIVENAINQIYIKNDIMCVASYYEVDIPHIHFTETYVDIFDIQTTNNIQSLTCIDASFDVLGTRAKIHYLNNENYLYLTKTGFEGTSVYNCNDLQNIVWVETFNTASRPIMINENYIITEFAEIFQFSNSTSIYLIDNLENGASTAWQFNNNILLNNKYIGTSYIYNLVSNEVTSHYYSYNQTPEGAGEYLLLYKDNSVRLIDLRYPFNTDELYHLDYNVNNFKLENDNIIFEIDNGLGIIDLTDPQFNLHEITLDYFDNFLINNEKLLVYRYNYSYTSFNLYDIYDLNNIQLLNTFDLPDIGKPYIILDNFIYCFNENALKTISISDPSNPFIVNDLTFGNEFYNTFIKIDSLLYMFGSGCAIVDITSAENPEILMETILPSNPNPNCRIEFINNTAYLLSSASDRLLHIYDFNDPLDPLLITTIGSMNIDRIFKVNDSLVGINNNINSIYFYELNNSIPYLSNEYNWNNSTYYLAEYDDYLITACGQFGIYALSMNIAPAENQLIQNIDLLNLANYPNPFNPSTIITFSIKSDSKVNLSVYNIKGQKVKELINNKISAGKHSFSWSGLDSNNIKVSSGVFLYKLSINGKTKAVNKCLLLK